AGRIGYYSDRTAGVTTWSSTVAGEPGALTVSSAVSLGHPGAGADSDVAGETRLSLSGANTAAAGTAHSISITSPVRTTTVATKHAASGVDLSGNRLVYQTSPAGPPVLYDLRTGRATTIAGAIAAAIWGNYLAYVDADGSVWRRALSGAATPVKLRAAVPVRQRAGLTARVSEYGDDVMWQVVAAQPKTVIHEAYRDAATMAPAVSLLGAYAPQAATSDGVLELKDTGTRADYYLQHYGSSHRTRVLSVADTGLLPDAPDGVAVDGGLIAWIDGANRARVAPLPVAPTPQAPRYLGDRLAPTSATPTKKLPWSAFIPMSAAMTACHVQILAGATVERTLKCAAADAALGDVSVRWDGRDAAGHKLSPGSYTWRLEAANSAGSALAADGASNPIQGRITVG
ncbi:MAG TPA: FlgD immunoglobulin-like domain containing protein, partial [Mycobacteriales bacterium]|nr:FlgD immunoglobulin-like domain containing protein [Mycobacteriales bacterium]